MTDNTQKAQGADDLLRQASIFSEALRKIPDEVFRDIAESRDVGHCRSRIAAVLVSLSQPQKAQGSGAGEAWRNVYRIIREATAVDPPKDENERLAFAEQLTGLVIAAALSQPPEASEVEAVLSCDVMLPPATTVRAGCSFETLRLAMSLPDRPKHFVHPPKASPMQELQELGQAFDAGPERVAGREEAAISQDRKDV